MSKSIFMEAFNQINTQGILLKEAMELAVTAEKTRAFNSELHGLTVGLSTGTSGKRGLFLVSETERAQWVALVMNRVIKPRLFKRQRVAFFLRANSNLYASVNSGLFEFKYFDIFKPVADLLDDLNNFQPHILAAQPSVMLDLVHAQQQGQIQITPLQLISFAEVLHDSDRDIISEVFKREITEVYQCTEGFLGVSCAYGTLHLNEDFIKIEQAWIDDHTFHPIITDFTRHSQPVVKYKLDDILQIKSQPCPCGSPRLAIEKILGRDDEVLIFNGQKIYPDLIARQIAIAGNAFQKYTITQISNNQLHIGIACREADFPANQNLFTAALDKLFKDFGICDILYQFENSIDHSPGNKLRKIRRKPYEN